MNANNWGDKFSHRAMMDLARFLTTYNMVSQTCAADANDWDLQTAGGGDCTINGVYIPALAADPALDINVDQVAPSNAWAQNTVYAVDDEVYTGTLAGADQKFWKCLKAHTASFEAPGQDDKWQAIPNLDGMQLADDFRLYIMLTVEADGTLGAWIASAHSAIGTVPTLKIPYFDPAIYCVVGLIDYANDAESGTVTFGLNAGAVLFSTDGTFHQVIGPVFPHPDNMPKN